MVSRKKANICNKVSTLEDRISHLPEHLISEILFHLSTKDAVRTSVLSSKWRYLWQRVPGLDLNPYAFSNFSKFVSFVKRFIYSNNESWIRKLRLYIGHHHGMRDISSCIEAVARRRIQHIDLSFDTTYQPGNIPPLRLYPCDTLVHLRLDGATLVNAEFGPFPCLKILHLEQVSYPNESTLENLISGSPVLEDLTINRYPYNIKVLQVRSQTLKKIDIDHFGAVIDAPLLQCIRTKICSTKNFQVINLGFSTKLDIDVVFSSHGTYNSSLIHDIMTDISRVSELVISNGIWKVQISTFEYI